MAKIRGLSLFRGGRGVLRIGGGHREFGPHEGGGTENLTHLEGGAPII